MRPQGALSWALPLVGIHAILLRGAWWREHTVRSCEEAAQLRFQVIPHLAHLHETEKNREVRRVATTWSVTSRLPCLIIWWHEHEVPHITLLHTHQALQPEHLKGKTNHPTLPVLTIPPEAKQGHYKFQASLGYIVRLKSLKQS